MKRSLIEKIDYQIKHIWMNEIADDYRDDFILKEDCLKNSLYYHLRNSLEPELKNNSLRIYTEFNEKGLKAKGYRADIAIVKLGNTELHNKYLGDYVEDVIAIIELKVVSTGNSNTAKILKDIEKTKNYIKIFPFENCQYYLGIIQENNNSISELQWLDKRQSNHWAKGRLTELNACYYDEHEDEYEQEEIGFSISSYNGFNVELNCSKPEKIRFVSMA